MAVRNEKGGNAERQNRFGILIREYRNNAGMSQEELGIMIGVGKNAAGAWESGRSRPDLNCISDLCHILNIPLYVFFGRSESLSVIVISRIILAAASSTAVVRKVFSIPV